MTNTSALITVIYSSYVDSYIIENILLLIMRAAIIYVAATKGP